MPPDLHPPLSTYFEATNAHDADRLAAMFAADAVVHDEGQEMVGRAAIRAWAAGTFDKYQVVATPLEGQAAGEAALVRARVAGSFPGSPIELDYRFRVADEEIVSLDIG